MTDRQWGNTPSVVYCPIGTTATNHLPDQNIWALENRIYAKARSRPCTMPLGLLLTPKTGGAWLPKLEIETPGFACRLAAAQFPE